MANKFTLIFWCVMLMLLVVFVTLKLTHIFVWSWLWVFSPIWLPFAIVVGLLLIGNIILFVIKNQ